MSNQELPWQPHSPEEMKQFIQSLRNETGNPGVRKDSFAAAIYTRQSRAPQTGNNHSPDYQEDDSEDYIRRQGWSIFNIYEDIDESGRTGNRKELRRLKRDIKAGKIDAVVIHDISRLYRNLNGLLGFVLLLIEHDVRLVSVTEQIDTETPWGMLVLQVLGAIAELFVRQNSERIRRMKDARAKKGLLNGRLPLGYCKGNCSDCTHPNGKGYCPNYGQANVSNGKVPVNHPIDQHAVRLIHNLYAQGMGYKEVADYLNTHTFDLPEGENIKFRTQGIKGYTPPGPFRRSSIRIIISNPTYTGMVAQYERPPLDMEA